MYRPYRVGEGGKELAIVFRDHALSDGIGFHYQRNDPVAGAEDFIARLRVIGNAVHGQALVPVILDGENCWEHYPGGGVTFLRNLYERCVRANDLKPVRIDHYLEQNPPRDLLPHLFAGSWINHSFAIWIGHEEVNTAWDVLHQTREHLKQQAQATALSPEQLRQAWEEIYIAQGSDWFWWYSDDHSSAQDALFDYLFRKHLQNVYLLLGEGPPAELTRPINRRVHRAIHTLPRAFLEVKIDGRRTFFEWVAAGRYTCHNERGTMAMATRGPLREVFFGFDVNTLFLRVDCDVVAHTALARFDELRVTFTEPAGRELVVDRPGQADQTVRLVYDGQVVETAGVAAGVDHIAEMAVPFDALGVQVDGPIQFSVDLREGGHSRDRAPRKGTINLTRPSPDFEQIMWDV